VIGGGDSTSVAEVVGGGDGVSEAGHTIGVLIAWRESKRRYLGDANKPGCVWKAAINGCR
jgi:hypothetical protein